MSSKKRPRLKVLKGGKKQVEVKRGEVRGDLRSGEGDLGQLLGLGSPGTAAEAENAKKVAAHARRTRANSSDHVVDECLHLMASGRWVRGVTVREVAEQFGITVDRASELASRASTVIRHAVEGDRDDIRARMLATLDTIISSHAEKNGKVAVAAIAEQGKLLGLTDSAPRVAVQVNVQQNLGELDDEALLSRVEAQMAKLSELRARLLAKQAHVETTRALPAHEEKNHE